MYHIISAPNPVLSQAAKNYVFKKGLPAGRQTDKFLPNFLKEMEDVLLSARDPKGVGLAAPQVGRNLSIFITKPTQKSKIQVFINPEITGFEQSQLSEAKSASGGKHGKKPVKLEGCLSLQDIWGEVRRPDMVTISYFDENGKKFTKKFTGFMATIVQHEIDHLHGILFPKRVLEQKGKLYHSSKNKRGEDEFEEISI